MSRLIGIFVLVCYASRPGSRLIGILSASEPRILRAFRIANLLTGGKNARLKNLILKEAEVAFFTQRDALLDESDELKASAASAIFRLQTTLANAILAVALVELGKSARFKRGTVSSLIIREISRELRISNFLRVILPSLKFIRAFGFSSGVNAALISFLQEPSLFSFTRIQNCLESPSAAKLASTLRSNRIRNSVKSSIK